MLAADRDRKKKPSTNHQSNVKPGFWLYVNKRVSRNHQTNVKPGLQLTEIVKKEGVSFSRLSLVKVHSFLQSRFKFSFVADYAFFSQNLFFLFFGQNFVIFSSSVIVFSCFFSHSLCFLLLQFMFSLVTVYVFFSHSLCFLQFDSHSLCFL